MCWRARHLTFVQAQKAAVSEQLAAAKRNFEVGTTTVTDSREAQARFDLVGAQEIAAENDLRVKKLALDQLVGSTGAQPRRWVLPVQLPSVAPDNVATWVQTARDQQPWCAPGGPALDVARLETRKAETGHRPTIDLQASYSHPAQPQRHGHRTPPEHPYQQCHRGRGAEPALFAGFAVQNRVKETLALEQSRGRPRNRPPQRRPGHTQRLLWRAVGHRPGQALEAAEQSSQSALDANKLGYQVGVRINIDVLNAQSQLYQTNRATWPRPATTCCWARSNCARQRAR